MKIKLSKDKKLMRVAIVLLLLSSASLLLSIFGDFSGSILNVVIAYIIGVGFWGFLIAGYVVFSRINSHRKKSKNNRYNQSKKVPGILCFFSNKYAKAADICMVVFLILCIVFSFIPINQYICVVCVAVFIFSLHMHAVLNGVNFKYINQKIKES